MCDQDNLRTETYWEFNGLSYNQDSQYVKCNVKLRKDDQTGDLNPGPSGNIPDALPTELSGLTGFITTMSYM